MVTRYDAVAVRRYKDRDGNEKSQFTTIGTAWPMKDRDGFTVRLNAIPASVEGEYVVLLMSPKEKSETRTGGSSRGEERRGGSPAGGFSREMDDDIPFSPEFR